MGEQRFVNHGMKFLHYGPGGNAIIVKPGQQLNVKQFDEEDMSLLKEVYLMVKCLKDALGIDLKSYHLKKVLLKKSVKSLVGQLGTPNKLHELFFRVIHLNELRRKLRPFIVYDTTEAHHRRCRASNSMDGQKTMGIPNCIQLTQNAKSKIEERMDVSFPMW